MADNQGSNIFSESNDEFERRRRKGLLTSPDIPTEPNEQKPADSVNQPASAASAVGGAETGPAEETVSPGTDSVKRARPAPPNRQALMQRLLDLDEANNKLKAASVDTSKVDEQLRDAKQAYREKADRNELLSLVQMVGDSMAQLAAARYGERHKRYINDQITAPRTDYEKRTDRALDELKMEQGEGRDQRKFLLDKAATEYQAEKDKVAGKEKNASLAESMYRSDLQAWGVQMHDLEAQDREDARDKDYQNRLRDAQNKQDRTLAARLYSESRQEEQKLLDSQKYIQSLVGAAADKKKRDSALTNLKAKVDEELGVGSADAIMEKAPKKEGIIWDSEDPTKQADALAQTLYGPIRNRLDKIRTQKEQSLAVMNGQTSSASSTYQNSTSPTKSGMVTLISPSGKEGQVPADKVEEALSQGYNRK